MSEPTNQQQEDETIADAGISEVAQSPNAVAPDDEEDDDDNDTQASAGNGLGMQRDGAHDQGMVFETEVKEQDRWLPIANVARIMKTALPENAKIAKEAKECMQECVSEFISFITSEASEKCQQEKRKTVNGEDILFAMSSVGFENYQEVLKIYLSRYRESGTSKPGENSGAAGSGGQGQGTAPGSNEGSLNSASLKGDGSGGSGGLGNTNPILTSNVTNTSLY